MLGSRTRFKMTDLSELKKIKEIIKIADEAIKDAPEKFQLEAFKIILEKLLSNKFGSIRTDDYESPREHDDKGKNHSEPLHELVSLCEISKDDLKNVISINDNNIEVVCRIDGTESHQQVVGSLIILLSREILFKEEWIKSTAILDSLKKIGIQDKGGNFSTHLKKHSDIFLKKGTLQEYRLTTNNGRAIARKVINNLSKGKQIVKDDLKVTE